MKKKNNISRLPIAMNDKGYKVKVENLFNANLNAALGVIANCKDFDVSYLEPAFNGILAIEKKTMEYGFKSSELLNKYGKRDNQGNYVQMKDSITGKIGIELTNSKAYNQEYQQLINQEVFIEGEKLKLEDLKAAKLSPVNLGALKPFIQI